MGEFEEVCEICAALLKAIPPCEIEQRLWLKYSDENPYLLQANAELACGRSAEAESVLKAFFENHPAEAELSFGERHRSGLWRKLIEAGIVSKVVPNYSNDLAPEDQGVTLAELRARLDQVRAGFKRTLRERDSGET